MSFGAAGTAAANGRSAGGRSGPPVGYAVDPLRPPPLPPALQEPAGSRWLACTAMLSPSRLFDEGLRFEERHRWLCGCDRRLFGQHHDASYASIIGSACRPRRPYPAARAGCRRDTSTIADGECRPGNACLRPRTWPPFWPSMPTRPYAPCESSVTRGSSSSGADEASR